MTNDMSIERTSPRAVDVHHHLYPPDYLAALVERKIAPQPARDWTPAKSIEDMDRAGVETSITSITAPGLSFVDPGFLQRIARECNDYAARMAADYPGRFGLFGTLPLPDIEGSLREAEYALDVLGADGVCVLTSYGNKWLGDPDFAPLLDELNRRQAVIYVHPTAPDCCRNLLPGIPDWVLEFPADTTRTITSLLFSGTVARCPNIRFVFAHLGGTMPFISEHLVRIAAIDPELASKVPEGILPALRRFHYDTALRGHPATLASFLEVMGTSQMLFGTDAPLRVSRVQLQGVLDFGFSEDELAAILHDNAYRVLPRLSARGSAANRMTAAAPGRV
jgi:predicted TIM-barrel fold metal-dependent hydrolase